MSEPKITRRKLSDYAQDSRNANQHTPRGLGIVEDSLGYSGVGRSLVADKNDVFIAGNLTSEAAANSGIEDVIEIETDGHALIVHKRRDLDLSHDARAKALAVADNRSSEISLTWDDNQLAELLTEIRNEDAELLKAAGFYDNELDDLLSQLATDALQGVDAPEAQVDRADELRDKWNVELGQVWQLGRHRLACIDSTDENQLKDFLKDITVNMVFADPPYGISIVATNGYVGGGEAYDIPFGGVKNRQGDVGGGASHMRKTGKSYMETNKHKGLGTANGSKPFGSKAVRGSDGAANIVEVGKYAPVIGDDTIATAVTVSALCLSLYPKAYQFWWGGNYYAHTLPPSSCWVVWDKQNTGNFADVELAWTNIDKAARLFSHMWNGMLKDSEHGVRRVHPTQKPVELARWCFTEFGKDNDVIFDPFAGSGITVIAGEQLKRTVYACELSPEYIAVIIQRWVDLTGLTPKLSL